MIPRIRWQALAFCGFAAVCYLLILLAHRLGTSGTSNGDERAATGSMQSNQTVAPSPSQGIPGQNAIPEVLQQGSEDATSATLKKLLASPPSESGQASELVATMTDLQLAESLKNTNRVLKTAAAFEAARRSAPRLVLGLLTETSVSSDSKARNAMLSAIASIKSDGCVKELVTPLGLKKDEDIQEAARTSLLRNGSPIVVDTLIAHAGTAATNEYLCRDVGRTLAKIRNEASIPNLLAGIGSPSPSVVAGCVTALAAIGEPLALEALFSQLGSAQGFQETLLTKAIAQVRSPAGLPVLSSQLLSSSSNLKESAKRAVLAALGNFHLDQRTPIITQYLAVESDSRLQAEAARMLGR